MWPGVSGPLEPGVADGILPGRFIVSLHPGVDARAFADDLRGRGREVLRVYSSALTGVSFAGAPLADDPRIAFIEPDRIVHTAAQELSTGIDRIDADENATASIDGLYDPMDVDVAVLDTGIDVDHPDLNVIGGRHFWSWLGLIPFEDSNYDDDNGHGTHVAGIVGALDNDFGVVGVAPGARLLGVKVLNADGSGYLSDVIAGVEYLRTLDYVDGDRMAIHGTSYGGCMSMSAVAFAPGVFQAAVPQHAPARQAGDASKPMHRQELDGG